MPKTLTVKRTTIQEFNISTADLDMEGVEDMSDEELKEEAKSVLEEDMDANEGEVKSDTIEITNIV